MEQKIDVDPDAWASIDMCVGPNYGKIRYDKLPIQSLNPLQYTHEKLYSEKTVISLCDKAFAAGRDSLKLELVEKGTVVEADLALENAKLRALIELIFASTLPYNDGEPTFGDKVTPLSGGFTVCERSVETPSHKRTPHTRKIVVFSFTSFGFTRPGAGFLGVDNG